jgi:hypothetical protein
MTYPDLSYLQVAGFLFLAGLFVLREITSGALKEAGKELWTWAREKRSRRNHHCRCQDPWPVGTLCRTAQMASDLEQRRSSNM